MLFSELFELGDVRDEEWFDPILSIDTHLFIDPFLLYDNEQGDFVGSHGEIIAFFEKVFKTIAQSDGSSSSVYWKRAERLLLFPEVEELCLGYTGSGTGGGGSGDGIATSIASGLWNAIRQGVKEIKHFEEVQIFDKGVGPDRISDATAGILRRRFALYTSKICDARKIPTQSVRYQRAVFDVEQERWVSAEYRLPINPYNRKPILLVPKRYLRPLPTINPDDYWEFCYDNRINEITEMFGEDIARHVDKETIIQFARRFPDTREQYVAHKEAEGAEPYDFFNDPQGAIRWYDATATWAKQHPLALSFSSKEEFKVFVSTLIEEFRNFVENNRGWSLLWNENETPKREEAAQLLFLGIVKHYCAANNVDISKEVNIGRGPVDFKVAAGYVFRSLIELKLAKNTRFWHGLENQLPKYLQAEGIHDGRFVVIVYTESDIKKISHIEQRVKTINEQLPYQLICEVIDAERDPPSASLL